MKKRITEVRELIEDKNKELDSLNEKAEKESRGWDEKELDQVKTLQSELEGLRSELEVLEKEEKRKKAQAEQKLDEEKRRKDLEEPNEEEKTEVRVGKNKLEEVDARNAKTFALIKAQIHQNPEARRDAAKALVEGGHFPKEIEERNFSTLTDAKGGILIPKTVSDEIFDIEQGYGFIPQHALNLGNIGEQEVTIPNILSRPSFFAVGEGQAISGSGLNLGGIAIKAKKWGAIVNWTSEVSDEVGAKLMPILQRKIAEGLAFKKDDAFFNGDGGSTYNNIFGIINLTGEAYVRQGTAATGNTAFATVTADDYLNAVLEVAPGARTGAVWAVHPNQILNIKKLKDDNGSYIYQRPSEAGQPASLWGYPIVETEAFPFSDGTSAQVAAFVNPMHVAYANGRELRAEPLREGTITDEDGNTRNLATTDSQAIRWTTKFDEKLDNTTRSDAGTTKGAFSLLRTAAS